jgi:hypothetical protein
MMSSNVENEPDIFSLLRLHNLAHVIENIVEYAGHTATVNMLCTCKNWNAILSELVPMRRIVFHRSSRNPHFARLCSLNGWNAAVKSREETDGAAAEETTDLGQLAYINYASTDLRRVINR